MALFSPRGSPRVSDDVVVLAVVGSVSNNNDGVVKSSSTSWVVHNTSSVSSEVWVSSSNGDRNWALVDSGNELVNRSGWHLMDGGDVDLSRELGGSASLVRGLIWIVALKNLSVLLNVLHTILGKTTLATVADVIAVNELLLSELDEVSGLNSVMTLNVGSGSERPARSAHSLVLNWVDCSLLSPVDGSSVVSSWELGEFAWLVELVLFSHHSLEFVVGHGGEHVMADGEGVFWVLVDEVILSIVLLENVQSVFVLLLGVEGETVLSNVLNELLLNLWSLMSMRIEQVANA